MRSDSAIATASWAGDRGAEFAAKGDRYLPRGGVRHRTQQSIFASFLRTSACGIVASETEWRGTGSQDEYERLSRIPRCSNCIRVEKRGV